MASNRPDSGSGSASGSDASMPAEDSLFSRAQRKLFKKKEEATAAICVQERAEAAVLRHPRTAQPAQPAMPDDGSSSLDSYDDSSQDKTIEYERLTGASSEERRERHEEEKRKITPQTAKKTVLHSS